MELSMLVAAEKLLNCPFDREIPQIRIVLSNTNKKNGHVGRVHKADESAHHVADGVAFGDDEAVKRPHGSEGSVEVAGLCHGIRADQSLSYFCQQRVFIN